MSTNAASFRMAFETQIAKLPPDVQRVHRTTLNAITDIYESLPILKQQIDAKANASTASASSTSNTTTGSQTVIVSGSTIGLVNNQVGVTSYSTLPSDNGAFILLGDSSPIAVTLNGLGSGEGIVLPFFCWILNFGTATATLTPDSGDINNAADYSLEGNNGIVLSYDGVNFWAEPTSPEPQNTPAVPNEWLDSYDSSTGAFGQSQPAFTNISGVAATDQIGTGTPSAGEYVDGGTGAWTALPAAGANFADSEVVSGSGTTWTLAHTPIATPLIVVMVGGFGGVTLLLSQTPGFTITGTAVTTTNSYLAGAIYAWYRY
jgi:hypothetical protein